MISVFSKIVKCCAEATVLIDNQNLGARIRDSSEKPTVMPMVIGGTRTCSV